MKKRIPFKEARDFSPCIMFLNNLESSARYVGVTSQLVQQLNAKQNRSQDCIIVVIGAANALQNIAEELHSSFEVVNITIPQQTRRKKILRRLLPNIQQQTILRLLQQSNSYTRKKLIDLAEKDKLESVYELDSSDSTSGSSDDE